MKSFHRRLLPSIYATTTPDRWSSASPFNDFGRLLEGFLGSTPPTGMAPRAEVTENDEAYSIALELPGVAEDEIDLSFEDGVLTVRGEKRDEHTEGEENRRRTERYYGSFERSFALPSEVDLEKSQARFERGVLTVSLPKNREERSAHRIPIQRG